VVVAPAFPLDARLRSVRVDGREQSFQASRVGDVQRAEVAKDGLSARTELVFVYDEGTDVYARADASEPGSCSGGLRILPSTTGS
jgi:hypothetical protein